MKFYHFMTKQTDKLNKVKQCGYKSIDDMHLIIFIISLLFHHVFMGSPHVTQIK